MFYMMSKKLILPLLLIFTATCALAQTHINEFGIQSDNDSYLAQKSDRYYTDGLFFYFNHALEINSPASSSLQNKVLGFELGQKIYNPQGGNISGPNFIDRPFAGYLYAGSSLNYLFKNESNIKIGAQIGIVGPASFAEQTQTFVHKTFGFYTPTGWQYQIKNDVELNLSAQYNRLLARTTGVDVSLASYANLGTGFTGAGAGPLFRIGKFNQLFNSASTQSTAIVRNAVAPLTNHELFLYYKPQANYIAYDATVQGSLFTKHNQENNEETVRTPESFMFSNEIGLTYTSSRWVLTAAATFHTKDVDIMLRPHQWGSVTVLYRFN